MELTLWKGSKEAGKRFSLGCENSEGRSAEGGQECQGVPRQTKLLDKDQEREGEGVVGRERGGKAGWLASGLKPGSLEGDCESRLSGK